MRLCVGAASRRIIEEAAKLKVHQIVASRRQVAHPVGYTGLSPVMLVDVVRKLSNDQTKVVRDHGGPLQGGFNDDGVDALDQDVAAGFHSLHIDVCELPRSEQRDRLVVLCRRYAGMVAIEVGGEHEHASWNTQLLSSVLLAGIRPSYIVVGAGTYVWADRQVGHVKSDRTIRAALTYARKNSILTKVHNMDAIGDRQRYHNTFDAYNLAPELGQVEVRALLTVLNGLEARQLLEYAYESEAWRRWFNEDEGTYQERAECAVRYLLEDEKVTTLVGSTWSNDREIFVRRCIRDAILHG